jgi:hypothetical protein
MDPTMAFKHFDGLKKAAQSYGIDISHLLGNTHKTDDKRRVIKYHGFERFQSQMNLIDRFRYSVNYGKSIKSPIKVGLTWIE